MPIPEALGWYEVTGTMIAQTGVCAAYPADNCHGVFAYSGGCFDTLRNRIIVWGGGHNDSSDNSVYALSLSGTAARLTNSTGCGNSSWTCDGGVTPNSRHTYDGVCYMANVDKMFIFSGAPAGAGFPADQDTWLFNFSNVTWEYKTPTLAGGIQPQGGNYMACAYDSVSGKAYVNDGLHSWSYNATTNAYTSIGGAGPFLGGWGSGVVDPVRRKFWVIGGGDFKRGDISGTGSQDFVDLRGSQGGTLGVSAATFPGLAYEPTLDRILAWIGGNTVYSLNLDTLVWSTITAYSGGPGALDDYTHGSYGRWGYSSASGVCAIVKNSVSNVFTFRAVSTTPDTEAPTAPASLTATAMSASRIDLAWTASTDNIGVTEYLIEQCSGAACANFTQVHTTTTNSYSDVSGLSASTLYRYRVRATDAAGNLSTYSNIAEDTTDAADTTPPTDPADLVATMASYNEIDLTWTASTDDVGVANYRVERCSGPACSTFVQVAAPVTNSWNDTGLAQGTTYRYRVRAVDAAGNFSGYSNIASDTTSTIGVLQVGSTKTYATLSAAIAVAVDGDVIECDPETYQDDTCTITQQNITVRGVGTGYAHFKWKTGDHNTAGADIPNGQAIIKFLGSGTLENLEFSGAKVTDGNGAGIRYNGGTFTIRHCYFHNNESGVLGQSAAEIQGPILTIEYCIFQENGYLLDGFYAHNVYIGAMPRFIFRYNASVDPDQAHCLKSRAYITEVLYNYISTKNSTGSLEVEFPNGHVAYVIGNLIVQGDASDNSTIISYGAEGLTTPTGTTYHELYVINNTIYNWRTAGATYIQMVHSPAYAKIVNNAYDTGGGTWRSGTATTLVESNNVALSDEAWVDVQGDFHLTASAVAAIDAGINPGVAEHENYPLTPVYEYGGGPTRTVRSVVGSLDISAYEYGTPAPPELQRLPFSRRT